MLNHKIILPLLISFILLAFIVIVNVNTPAMVQAAPLPGFTPDPGDDGGDNDDGDGTDNETPTTDHGRTPTDYVLVRLDQCDMTCDLATTTAYQPLAYNVDKAAAAPFLIPMAEADVDFEIIAPVQMVHDGSGFIAVGELSTQHDTRISVPYPGRWELFLTDEPRFMTATAVDVTGTNLSQVEMALNEGPVSMGVVEANTAAAQLVKCPIDCVIDTPLPTTTEPPTLPVTGSRSLNWPALLILLGLSIAVLATSLESSTR